MFNISARSISIIYVNTSKKYFFVCVTFTPMFRTTEEVDLHQYYGFTKYPLFRGLYTLAFIKN